MIKIVECFLKIDETLDSLHRINHSVEWIHHLTGRNRHQIQSLSRKLE